MTRRGKWLATVVAALAAAIPSGCVGTIGQNLVAEKTGNVTMIFINNTPYTAIFSCGTYDAWDRSPGAINLEQLTVDPNTSSAPTTIACARNAAVGTAGLVERVIATGTDETADFNADLFDSVVRFSSAPAGTPAATLPSAGTAEGIERLLGVDYSCGDQLIFTFLVDPDAEGGFRIDFEVILDEIKN